MAQSTNIEKNVSNKIGRYIETARMEEALVFVNVACERTRNRDSKSFYKYIKKRMSLASGVDDASA